MAAGAALAHRPVGKRVIVLRAADSGSYRKPFLRALTPQPVPKGEERITIPVDGVLYEIVIPKPGEGRLIDVTRRPNKPLN